MSADHSSLPRVTIVMTARERHALAETAIESIVAETTRPYRFIYLDVQSPVWLREVFAQRAAHWGLEVLRFDEPLWPQEARRRVLGALDTDYVVFIDNDIQVYPGWLEALVACADETGAGIVGPLYLWSDGVAPPRIHMAGGKLVEARGERGRLLYESHQMLDAELEESEAQLARSPCDFVEFHCMLIRNELLREGATVLDPAIRCIHEHIDVALAAKQRGYPVFIEPKARVNYLAFAEYLLEDLPFFRKRWSAAVADADIAVFCRKWNVVDDARAFGVRNFVRDHLAQIDPLRAASPLFADRAQPMQREEFAQSRSALLDLALARGYSSAELTLISDAYHVAQVLMDGGYRPCGRPFINHLAGTASVLIRYGFRVEMIAAGLLHSVYTHCPAHPGGPQAALETVQSWLGGKDSALERRVRAYSLRGAQDGGLLDPDASAGLFVLDSEVIALLAANEIDQHLSGEFRYANRDDQLEAPALQAIEQVGRILGVEGLAETLLQALREQGAPVALPTRMRASYRIGADRRSAVPMMSNVLAALAAEDPM